MSFVGQGSLRSECGWFEKQMLAHPTATFSNYRTLSAKIIPPWKTEHSREWSCVCILLALGCDNPPDRFPYK